MSPHGEVRGFEPRRDAIYFGRCPVMERQMPTDIGRPPLILGRRALVVA